MKRRILALLLAMLMLATSGILAACGGDKPGKTPDVTTDGQGSQNAGNDTTAAPVETGPVLDIPDEDLDGYEYLIYEGAFGSDVSDFTYLEEAGTVLDEAKYKRNALVEAKFNISLISEVVKVSGTSGSDKGYGTMMQNYNAGDPTYNVTVLPAYDQSKLAQNSALYDMTKVPMLDLTSEYWDQNVVKDLTIKDMLFFMVGDYSIDAFDAVICMAFNKKIAGEKGINDLYQLVTDGKWTLAKFKEYCALVSEDLNGDDKYTNMDLYGALCWDDTIYAVVHSAGELCATVGDDGLLVLGLNSEKMNNVFEEFVTFSKENCFLRYQVAFKEDGSFTNNSGSKYGSEMFLNNQGLFYMASLGGINGFRDMDVDYGIIPLFKYTEEETRYYATISPYSARFLSMPYHQEDVELNGKILETIGFYSASTVPEAYYEKTLNGKVVRDEESITMLQLLRESRVYDLGYFYQPGEINKNLIYRFRAADPNWASTYAAQSRAAGIRLKQINQALEKLVDVWAE